MIRPGDILLYRNPPHLPIRLVEFGEFLEHGEQLHMYYHVAVAVDGTHKIEANGNCVAIAPIDDGGVFDVYRPPIPLDDIHIGLNYIKSLVGQRYDWMLIVDDALRYATHNIIHLPVAMVRRSERYRKICSTVVAQYFAAANYHTHINLTMNASPEDIYLVVKHDRVKM